jgi:phosphonate transport system substrate-binding protein
VRSHQSLMKSPSWIFPQVILLTVATFATLTAGCSHSAQDTRSVLRLSMIPTTDPGKIVRESQPFVTYIEKQTGTKVELTIPTNYAAVVEAIANDRVDIAYLGGFTFVQASARAGVLPLVQRDQDQAFHSLFITQPKSSIHSLKDLKAHTFAFGDVNSTSGHLMPAYFMQQQGVDPVVIEKATYTGGHDATALAVANAKVDAGAMDELVYGRMVRDGKLNESQIRIFYTTPPFFDYVWAARKGLDPAIAQKFADAMLALDAGTPEQQTLLTLLNAKKYVKAENSSYDPLRQAAKDAGLLK